MLVGRFLLIIPVLAIAGSLGRKQEVPATAGTFPTDTPLFGGLLVGVVVIVVGLTYFPVVALGPIVEHLVDARSTEMTATRRSQRPSRAGCRRRAGRRRCAASRASLARSTRPSCAGPRSTRSSSSTRARWSRNPVMFVVQVGRVLDHGAVLPRPRARRAADRTSSPAWWPLWLWFTVLFANFAEAMAEGRGKAQADTLRKTRGRDRRHGPPRRRHDRRGARRPQLQIGDLCVVDGRRADPRRRRRRRGHRLGRRVGHHRRVGPGHPRVRRRPLGRHRRHPGAVRPDRGAGSPPSRARPSSTG